MTDRMPDTFFWGNSSSSMQTEGAAQLDGKGRSVYDVRPAGPNTSDWQVAIDDYHRYEEDLDLMQAMHMNMYRLQISWSRVVPDGDGEFNQAGIAFYDRLIDACIARGITPMVCLYHFDMPLALAKKYNGFMSRHTVDAFVRFGQAMIAHFHDRVKYWLVFNEHNLYFTDEVFNISGYLKGEKTLPEMYQIFHHTMLAHARLDAFVHQTYPDVKIGGMLAYTPIYPQDADPKTIFAARQLDEFLNNNLNSAYVNGHYSPEVWRYIKRAGLQFDWQPDDAKVLAQQHADFIAFSYYRSAVVDATKIPDGTPVNRYLAHSFEENSFVPQTEWGWAIDPLGLRNVITKLYDQYQVPVFPVENGIGIHETWDGKHPIDDTARIDYHRAHIQAMQAAMFEDGAEVLGYLGWGLIDIPSSHADMEKRYGAVYVNRGNHDLRDLRRVPKKSFYWFQQVFGSNGEKL
ncbi:glycoside hydrolase family 1 protein [Lacticaseibacillus manihotivorans]|nr:glycoside hydrolase family 1 protein [Lacticaseibacillus manihotivorans]QFQ91545.1 family 1 glycosylhydrolase [Lacticaseibacillus manihotivorans]